MNEEIKEYIRNFVELVKEEWVPLSLIISFIFIVLYVFAPPYDKIDSHFTILDKQYSPSSSHTGVGTGIDTKGNPTTVITTTSESEKWILILNNYKSYQVSSSFYYSTEVGYAVTVRCIVGTRVPFEICDILEGE